MNIMYIFIIMKDFEKIEYLQSKQEHICTVCNGIISKKEYYYKRLSRLNRVFRVDKMHIRCMTIYNIYKKYRIPGDNIHDDIQKDMFSSVCVHCPMLFDKHCLLKHTPIECFVARTKYLNNV